MYIEYEHGESPSLTLKVNEPKLLNFWYQSISVPAMSAVWKLDAEKGQVWHEELYRRVISKVNSGAEITSSDFRSARDNFRLWVDSHSDGGHAMRHEPLNRIAKLSTQISALLLVPDVLCLNCEDIEPAFVFAGTPTGSFNWYACYRHINTALDKTAGEMYPELSGCYMCQPDDYILTGAIRKYARCKPGMCECMPCRRVL
jgi:hypothetical protein